MKMLGLPIIGILIYTGCPAPPEHGHEHGEEEGEHHEEGHAGEVHLSPEALRRASIRLAPVQGRVLSTGTGIPAEVRLDPTRTAHIAPLSPGRLTRVDARPGMVVQAGDILAITSSSEIATLAAKGESLKAQLSAARSAHNRQKALASEGIASQRALIEADATVRQLQAEANGVDRQLELLGSVGGAPEVPLKSPIPGVIVEMHATLGEMTRVEEPPFIVSDPSQVWIVGLVPELRVREAVVGKRARLRVSAYPGEAWEGRLEYVAPALDEQARALPVRMTLANPDGRLHAGLFGTLELLGGADGEAPVLAVPSGAVVVIDGREAVFVPGHEEGSFVPTFIETGRRDVGWIEVTGGLTAEQPVVTQGAFTLKSALQKGALAEHEH